MVGDPRGSRRTHRPNLESGVAARARPADARGGRDHAVPAARLRQRSLRAIAERAGGGAPGIETDTVVAFGIDPTLNGHRRARVEELYARVKAGLDATPGIDSSAMGLVRLLAPLDVWAVGVTVEGTPSAGAASTAPQVNAISPDYFRTLGIAMRAGRDFARGTTLSRRPSSS